MEKPVHPLIATLVIAGAVLAAGLWAWGSGEAKKFGGPAQLLTSPNGHLYVQMQNVLLEHDATGDFVARHDLEAFGVKFLLGDIGVFADGSLLLRRGADNRTLLDKLRAWRRETNQTSVAGNGNTGLFRCDLRDQGCEPFGESPVDFNAAYSVTVDHISNDVFIADTSRHSLRKYAANGSELAGPIDGFYFPNGMHLQDQRLFVADTNKHRVVVLSAATDDFGTELDSIDVVPGIAERAGHRWPSRVSRVDEQWWVNLMQSGMDDGGVYVFDDNWRFLHQVPLPAGADPIDIQPFDDAVLISDWNNDIVYRVARDGKTVADFESAGLKALIEESVEARWRYEVYSWLGIALFVLIIVALVIKAIIDSITNNRQTDHGDAIDPPWDEPVWLRPMPERVRTMQRGMRLIGLLVAALLALTVILILFEENRAPILWMLLPITGICAFFLFIAWVTRAGFNTAIGLEGDTITLRDHNGREQQFKLSEVQYDGATLAAGGMAVLLGQPAAPIYDRQQLMQHLFPRLARARSVSVWHMQLLLMRSRHPQGLMLLVALATVLITMVVMLIQELAPAL